MPIQYNSSAEAFAAVGLVALAADGRISGQEAMHVFESMKDLPVFKGQAGFYARRVLAGLLAQGVAPPSASGDSRTASEDDTLILDKRLRNEAIRAAKDALDATEREQALRWAIDLAFADELDPQESEALYHLADELSVERSVVDSAIPGR